MAREQDSDSWELFSDIEKYLKDEESLGPWHERIIPKEELSAETLLKRKVLKQFFEQNYTACMGLHEDKMNHAEEMHREFKSFLLDQQEDYHVRGDFGMESLVSLINFKDALDFASYNIKTSNILLSKGAYEYDGINVLENKKVWRDLRSVIRTAASIDKQIQQAQS